MKNKQQNKQQIGSRARWRRAFIEDRGKNIYNFCFYGLCVIKIVCQKTKSGVVEYGAR